LGYVVFEAGDATAALEILRSEANIRLLFTDLGLPGGIDGKVLAERARAHHPLLKVLITTAYAESLLSDEGRLTPGIDLLTKPFSFAALATRIRDVLDTDREDEPAATCILVVEDEYLLRSFVIDALTERELKTETAGSFKEALVKIQGGGDGFAGVILDVGLPDGRGDELVPVIRATRPDVPIVLTTGYAKDDIRARFADDKRLEILTKPFNPSELLDVIQRLGIRMGGSH
jgi:DNA-binding response OmpR family regulator